jgi:hypothetical protein
MFRSESDRIGLERQKRAARTLDLVLVGRPFAQTGDEDLPHARRTPPPHGVPPTIPDVEVADHACAFRIGRPDREMDSLDAFMADDMRTKRLPELAVCAFAQQVFVHLAQDRTEAVGILELPGGAMPLGAQPVGGLARHRSGEKARDAGIGCGLGLGLAGQHPKPVRTRHEGGNLPALRALLQAQD